MKESLIQRIKNSGRHFTLYHTHAVTKASINTAIEKNKSMDLDISLDVDGNPYLGHTEDYYEKNGIEKPDTLPLGQAVDLLSQSEIPIIVDCKHKDAWPVISKVVKKLGAHRCMVHTFVGEFKFTHNIGYDQDYPDEWSAFKDLANLKQEYPEITTTVSCKYLPEDLLINSEYIELLKEIRDTCVENGINTICFNVPDNTMCDEVLKMFGSQDVFPHINVDMVDISKFNNIFVGETDMLSNASDCTEIGYIDHNES